MDVLEVLDELKIKYEKIEHEAVRTVEDCNDLWNKIEGIGCKNLFLTSKGKYYLYFCPDDKKVNIKEIGSYVGASHLSFANEEDLMNVLGVVPGSVTPLGIMNDKDNKVLVILDRSLKNKKVLLHPNRNTATISISYSDLVKFIKNYKHNYLEV